MKIRVCLKVLAVIALTVTCLSSAVAAEITVAPRGGDFSSIQEAINHASSGDTITIQSGTYQENVRIDKRLVIKGVDTGSGAPVIDPEQKGNAVEIRSDGCRFEGFTIKNSESASGIRISSDKNVVTDNTINNNELGILLVSATQNTISGNNISENSRAGIVFEGSRNNQIENNVVSANTLGILLDEYSLSNSIFLNTFANTQNVFSRSITSEWHSGVPYTYHYLGTDQKGVMGNYWSDYRGRDANRDGIGDDPYVIGLGVNKKAVLPVNQNVIDPAPLMDPKEYYTLVSSGAGSKETVSASPTPQPATPTSSPTIVPTTTVPASPASSPLAPTPAGGKTVFDIRPGILELFIIALLLGGGAVILLLMQGKRTSTPSDSPDGLGTPPPLPSSAVSPPPSASDTLAAAATISDSGGPYTPSSEQRHYFPKELENKYTDITYIGRGGIAWVFSALRKTDGKKVAVKIPISFDEVTGKSFLNEIKAWEMLRHPNIVEISAVNILPVPYVEMEFVPGSLQTIEKPLPVWKAVHIINGIADALKYAHAQGFVHRDIKPHNILLTEDLIPKITDWGMSKVLAADTKKSSIAGFSLSYAAPEQVSPTEFGRTDARTDIYQLGMVFFELVTGSIPFGGESFVEVGNAILREKPIPPSKYNPDAQAVEKIILRCLKKDPALRYQSAAELVDALSGYLDEDDP